MYRIYLNINDLSGIVTITGDEFKHLGFSRRARVGDKVEIINGHGDIFSGNIVKFEKGKCEVEILEKIKLPFKEPLISIAFAMIEKGKFESALKSSVPFEISEFIPILTEHTTSSNKRKERFDKHRLEQIVINSMKQSGNPFLVELSEPIELGKLSFEKYDLIITSDLKGKAIGLYKTKIENAKKILLIIGPEGGFTLKEIEFIKEKGSKFVSLNQFTLRSEIAIISLLTICNMYRG